MSDSGSAVRTGAEQEAAVGGAEQVDEPGKGQGTEPDLPLSTMNTDSPHHQQSHRTLPTRPDQPQVEQVPEQLTNNNPPHGSAASSVEVLKLQQVLDNMQVEFLRQEQRLQRLERITEQLQQAMDRIPALVRTEVLHTIQDIFGGLHGPVAAA